MAAKPKSELVLDMPFQVFLRFSGTAAMLFFGFNIVISIDRKRCDVFYCCSALPEFHAIVKVFKVFFNLGFVNIQGTVLHPFIEKTFNFYLLFTFFVGVIFCFDLDWWLIFSGRLFWSSRPIFS
jgi:hypothetical protein